jgi:hypothetical protein
VLDLTTFSLVLSETIAWCSERASLASPSGSLRSPELQPPASDRLGLNETQIQCVVDERRRLLHSRLHPAHDLAGGRLLVYEPDQSLCDGAAMVSSDGFFDADNVPPWDTWLGYVYDEQFNRVYLLSWVPPVFLALADDGIEANPELCIRWAVDVKHAFLRKLQTEGLLA